MSIAEKIVKSRKEINLTQDQLAEKMEVSRQTISKWESELAYPETAKISKLADILGVSCDYLLKDSCKHQIEVTMAEAGEMSLDWTKLYPVLGEYEQKVDSEKYKILFKEMLEQNMKTYDYSLQDAVLVIKDLLYKSFLEMKANAKYK